MVLDPCEECDLVQVSHLDLRYYTENIIGAESGLNKKLKDNLLEIAGFVNEYTDPVILF